MKKNILIVMSLTILFKIIAYLKDVVLAYYYGTSSTADIFLIAITIPTLLFSIITGAVSMGFIPKYNEINEIQGSQKADKFTNDLNIILFVISTVLTLFIVFFSEFFVEIFASGFNEDMKEKASLFTKITAIALLPSSFIAIFRYYLNNKKDFITPSIITIPMNLIIILFIVISYESKEYFLAIGFVVGTVVQVFVLIPSIIKSKFVFRFKLTKNNREIKSFFIMIMPFLFSVVIDEINVIIDRTIASNIDVGSISALNYASKLLGIVTGIVVLSVVTASFPHISKMASSSNKNGFKMAITDAISIISILIVPATFLLMVYRYDIIQLMYARGEFGVESILNTSNALLFYSIGLLSLGINNILIRSFYALKDYKTPLYTGIATVSINIFGNILFFYFTQMGIGGLALATSISSIFSALLMGWILFRRDDAINIKVIIKSFLKIMVASILMIVIGSYFHSLMKTHVDLSGNFRLLLTLFISASVYIIVSVVIGVDEVRSVFNIVFKRSKKTL